MKSDLEAVDRPLRRTLSFSLFLFLFFSVSLSVGHAVARRHEHRRISFCARGIIMAEEEAKPSALAHVGRTLNDELDTARVREKRERKRERQRERKGVHEREPRREKKEKGRREPAASRTPTHFYLAFFILDETNDVHKSIDPFRLPFLISLFQVKLETRMHLSRQLFLNSNRLSRSRHFVRAM